MHVYYIIYTIERPNHDLSYTVGIDFCLEDMDSVWPNMTLECLLAADNEPDPLPDFSFRVERILVSSSTGFETQQIHMQMPINDSILQLNETDLLSLFDVDTESINVTCIVSNTFGSDMATTVITVCGINFIALTNTPLHVLPQYGIY